MINSFKQQISEKQKNSSEFLYPTMLKKKCFKWMLENQNVLVIFYLFINITWTKKIIIISSRLFLTLENKPHSFKQKLFSHFILVASWRTNSLTKLPYSWGSWQYLANTFSVLGFCFLVVLFCFCINALTISMKSSFLKKKLGVFSTSGARKTWYNAKEWSATLTDSHHTQNFTQNRSKT